MTSQSSLDCALCFQKYDHSFDISMYDVLEFVASRSTSLQPCEILVEWTSAGGLLTFYKVSGSLPGNIPEY